MGLIRRHRPGNVSLGRRSIARFGLLLCILIKQDAMSLGVQIVVLAIVKRPE